MTKIKSGTPNVHVKMPHLLKPPRMPHTGKEGTMGGGMKGMAFATAATPIISNLSDTAFSPTSGSE